MASVCLALYLHDSEPGLRINDSPDINLFIRGLVPSDICSVRPSVAKLAVLFSSGYKCHIGVSYLSSYIQYMLLVDFDKPLIQCHGIFCFRF